MVNHIVPRLSFQLFFFLIAEHFQSRLNCHLSMWFQLIAEDLQHLAVNDLRFDMAQESGIRDYIDVRDLSDAHIAALVALDEGRSGVYNLGNGEGWSVLNVVDAARAVTGLLLLQL